ncbi:response regulator [Planktothrix sp. FACHB-1355]|uniref:histidine kinase n=1 Tax=Aerosakkonema funiforme FACHB-1375 TaxID=2949571 RepID=A0A926VIU5_9CYAN|nr:MULTISPECIES: ATP-binding protein [Oscillatoriales]MBD2183492.1 response regulator [Aerosakkonema funiforme FACHB-1375]MBD3559401.1 response regulator [Planktothrix sp. FACHB-1355]
MTTVSKVNILVVDDRPANLMALTETLAPLKQNVVKAISADEALKHLLQQEFAVILLDVQMPGMNGFELAKIIHSRPATCHTPILFLTAINRDAMYILKGYSLGAVDYLLKPLIPEIILAKVSVFVDLFQKNAELKRQAEELRTAYNILQVKEQEINRINHNHQLILNAVGEGIYGVDYQGKTTFLNPAAAKMLGYTIEEAIGKPECSILNSKVGKNGDRAFKCPICASLKDGLVHYNDRAEFQRKDGSYFPVEYICTPILEQHEIIGAVITFKDITERRNIERMKDEFISVASHELRTPLTTIQGSLKLLARGVYDGKPEKAKEMLEVALRGTDRMIRLTNDLLDLQRLTTGKYNLNKQLCIASDLIQQAIADVQRFGDLSKVTLQVYPISVQVWADPNAIVQTLTNLLSNAIKFSPANTTVWLSAEVIESHERFARSFQSKIALPCVLFKIEDRGRGIPAEKLEIIFERFQQIDVSDSREKGGSGLGLAICKSIVQQHGGSIWAESILGQGSIFYFTLPLTLDFGQKEMELKLDCGTRY